MPAPILSVNQKYFSQELDKSVSLIGLKNEILDETSESKAAMTSAANSCTERARGGPIVHRDALPAAGLDERGRRKELKTRGRSQRLPGAHAKYDLGVCAAPDKLGHMYEMPDPVLLWQSVLAFAERGPEHRDPQFYMRHGDVENCESQ